MNRKSSPAKSRKKYVLAGGVFCLAAIAFFVISWLTAPQDPQRVAKSALDCTLSSVYECLWTYIPDTEREIYGISREQFIRIMDEYVGETFGQVKVVRRDVSAIGTGRASAKAEVILPSGKTSRVSIHAAKTPNGVVTVNLLATLVMLVQLFEAPETPGVHRIQHWLTRARRDGPRLTQLGMKGVYRGPEPGFETWAQWEARLEGGLTKLANAANAQ